MLYKNNGIIIIGINIIKTTLNLNKEKKDTKKTAADVSKKEADRSSSAALLDRPRFPL